MKLLFSLSNVSEDSSFSEYYDSFYAKENVLTLFQWPWELLIYSLGKNLLLLYHSNYDGFHYLIFFMDNIFVRKQTLFLHFEDRSDHIGECEGSILEIVRETFPTFYKNKYSSSLRKLSILYIFAISYAWLNLINSAEACSLGDKSPSWTL